MKLQTDISEDLNKKLKMYKLEHNLITLGEAAAEIIEKYFEGIKNE